MDVLNGIEHRDIRALLRSGIVVRELGDVRKNRVVWRLTCSLQDQDKNFLSVSSFYTVAVAAYKAFKANRADQIIQLTAGDQEGFILINAHTRASAMEIHDEYRAAVGNSMQHTQVGPDPLLMMHEEKTCKSVTEGQDSSCKSRKSQEFYFCYQFTPLQEAFRIYSRDECTPSLSQDGVPRPLFEALGSNPAELASIRQRKQKAVYNSKRKKVPECADDLLCQELLQLKNYRPLVGSSSLWQIVPATRDENIPALPTTPHTAMATPKAAAPEIHQISTGQPTAVIEMQPVTKAKVKQSPQTKRSSCHSSVQQVSVPADEVAEKAVVEVAASPIHMVAEARGQVLNAETGHEMRRSKRRSVVEPLSESKALENKRGVSNDLMSQAENTEKRPAKRPDTIVGPAVDALVNSVSRRPSFREEGRPCTPVRVQSLRSRQSRPRLVQPPVPSLSILHRPASRLSSGGAADTYTILHCKVNNCGSSLLRGLASTATRSKDNPSQRCSVPHRAPPTSCLPASVPSCSPWQPASELNAEQLMQRVSMTPGSTAQHKFNTFFEDEGFGTVDMGIDFRQIFELALSNARRSIFVGRSSTCSLLDMDLCNFKDTFEHVAMSVFQKFTDGCWNGEQPDCEGSQRRMCLMSSLSAMCQHYESCNNMQVGRRGDSGGGRISTLKAATLLPVHLCKQAMLERGTVITAKQYAEMKCVSSAWEAVLTAVGRVSNSGLEGLTPIDASLIGNFQPESPHLPSHQQPHMDFMLELHRLGCKAVVMILPLTDYQLLVWRGSHKLMHSVAKRHHFEMMPPPSVSVAGPELWENLSKGLMGFTGMDGAAIDRHVAESRNPMTPTLIHVQAFQPLFLDAHEFHAGCAGWLGDNPAFRFHSYWVQRDLCDFLSKATRPSTYVANNLGPSNIVSNEVAKLFISTV
ncbi:hypothetical protein CEUSTIGMA_g10367.t1 [Chlamydomonas eustigma]|uniref:Uncharacterized protein n=1 Tax=Chlamydomonas eustigma TaxID=1157962 RepID=A0A250XJF9_9CHLO|nr:hypothetical protein CEUSTIGMA_g10367.t1 [Chlamydomonas eustigma]|eukprot:GAX82940.1 hypothetical protein CEUSTIGMA_g10367.t1 [Chlamydomonas eustigma]